MFGLENIPDFIIDALKDSISLIPFLFFIFVFIELFENYFSKKIISFLKVSQKIGPVVGALFAIIPQCGFSIVATLLYLKKFITVGTLLSVYIATSDEAIPILLTNPEQFKTVGFLVVIKLILAVLAGYAVDMFIKTDIRIQNATENDISPENEEGCCHHHFHELKLKNLILHPIKHTFIIFMFILAVCLCLNFMFEIFSEEKIEAIMMNKSLLQPVFAGIFGLIPNCAVSVLITMMYLKGVLSFGSVVAGLSSGAGLGLLVLLKRNKDAKDTIRIISMLLIISIAAGVVFQLFLK